MHNSAHATWDLTHQHAYMYDAPHLTFCLPYLAGSRQTPAGCRHQSASSCGFQRCGKHVCEWTVKKKNLFKSCFWSIKCVLFCCRMTVSRLSSWRWQLSTLSPFSWYLSTGIFLNPSERLAGPPAYQEEASGTRSTPQLVQVILVFPLVAIYSTLAVNFGWGDRDCVVMNIDFRQITKPLLRVWDN